ncbi:unnamed protein product [Heterobilharzia americana]|nr:unnamed protein product [Heterobilharzia americana]
MEFLAVAISTLSAVTSGLAFGFSSSTTMQIYFTVSKSTFFTSSLNIGGLVGSLISVPMLNAIGRRFTLLVSCMASAMGWFWMYMCSDAVYEFSFPISLFILGRLLTGIGAGLCIPSVAVYMLEISSPRYRGMVGALPQVGIVTGICISFFLAIFMVWERIVFTSIIFSCVVLVLVWYLPESPKRLRSVRCPQDADNVDIRLSGTRSSHSTDTENNSIEATTKKHSFMVYMCPCSFIPSNQQPRLRMAIMLMIFQQLTGINAILFYAESVCLISSAFSPPVCAFYIGLFQMIFTIVAAFVINIVRRKKLLMLSAVIMAISQLAYAITISANVPSFMLINSGLYYLYLVILLVGDLFQYLSVWNYFLSTLVIMLSVLLL